MHPKVVTCSIRILNVCPLSRITSCTLSRSFSTNAYPIMGICINDILWYLKSDWICLFVSFIKNLCIHFWCFRVARGGNLETLNASFPLSGRWTPSLISLAWYKTVFCLIHDCIIRLALKCYKHNIATVDTTQSSTTIALIWSILNFRRLKTQQTRCHRLCPKQSMVCVWPSLEERHNWRGNKGIFCREKK